MPMVAAMPSPRADVGAAKMATCAAMAAMAETRDRHRRHEERGASAGRRRHAYCLRCEHCRDILRRAAAGI